MFAAAPLGCFVRGYPSHQVTGTCEGACDRYLDCSGGRAARGRTQCVMECRHIFHDAETLSSFEELSCPDIIEYVDGATAVTRR
jgi:hypothetical protein